jgi:hypothetical protein
LLIPRIFECLPQRIDHESLLLALHMAAEAANPYFRLGYNSLGAFATINHLHFQVLDSDCLSYLVSIILITKQVLNYYNLNGLCLDITTTLMVFVDNFVVYVGLLFGYAFSY